MEQVNRTAVQDFDRPFETIEPDRLARAKWGAPGAKGGRLEPSWKALGARGNAGSL